MLTVKLNNGVEMPQLGLGVFRIWDLTKTKETVLTGLKDGYRLIDTAASYQNEPAVGEAIRESGIPREEIFVTSKLWVQDMTYEGAKRGFQDSLDRLGLDYLDLYLIHLPIGDVYGAWRALEELYHAGKIRAIGVANFDPPLLAAFTAFNEVTPAVDQIQLNVFRQRTATVDYLRNNKIQAEAWGPLAQGRHDVFHNPVLEKIAAKYRRTTAQVMLRWLMQRGIVVIPKTVHEQRLLDNKLAFDFELLPSDMTAITDLERNDKERRTAADVKRILELKVHD